MPSLDKRSALMAAKGEEYATSSSGLLRARAFFEIGEVIAALICLFFLDCLLPI